jgi:uncharacterized protein (TIGR02646 family)
MIRLIKGAEPSILQEKGEEWTRQLLEKFNRGEEPTKTEKTRYNHPEVKAALLQETNQKCAYCESKLRHVTYGDIDHIVPKSAVREKWFRWQNLTLACDVCNTNKSAYFGDHDEFVDPYANDPETYFWFVDATLWGIPGKDAADITIRVLDLNRMDLIERRSQRLKNLMKLLQVIERTQNQYLKGELRKDFKEETNPDKEFAALAREFFKRATTKLNW